MSAQNNLHDELNTILQSKGYHGIQLEKNAVGHLTLNVKVNGITGNFILDTGASATVMERKQAGRFALFFEADSISSKGAGAGGGGLTVVPSPSNHLSIGSVFESSDFTIVLLNLEHVNDALRQMDDSDIEIVGVIGGDILDSGKAIIDYSNLKLYLLANM